MFYSERSMKQKIRQFTVMASYFFKTETTINHNNRGL